MSETLIQQTGKPEYTCASDGRVTINIPIQIRRRKYCRQITLPTGEPLNPVFSKEPTTLQLALIRGYCWLHLMESGEVGTLREIASRECVDNSYVSRMINMTVLAPDIIELILDNTLPNHLILPDLNVDHLPIWDNQRNKLNL